jgi:DNA-binding NtrC family response regulator
MSPEHNKKHAPLDILLVDDDVDYLFQKKLELEDFGFTVRTAETPAKAAQLMKEKQPDAAVIDLMMQHPDDGFVLAYEIKKYNPDIPVIMVTAVTSRTSMIFESITEYEKDWIKADCILSKPVLAEQIVSEIEKLIKR